MRFSCHLLKHLLRKALSLSPSRLLTFQHSAPYVKTDSTLLLYNRSFVPLLYWFDVQITRILVNADSAFPMRQLISAAALSSDPKYVKVLTFSNSSPLMVIACWVFDATLITFDLLVFTCSSTLAETRTNSVVFSCSCLPVADNSTIKSAAHPPCANSQRKVYNNATHCFMFSQLSYWADNKELSLKGLSPIGCH